MPSSRHKPACHHNAKRNTQKGHVRMILTAWCLFVCLAPTVEKVHTPDAKLAALQRRVPAPAIEIADQMHRLRVGRVRPRNWRWFWNMFGRDRQSYMQEHCRLHVHCVSCCHDRRFTNGKDPGGRKPGDAEGRLVHPSQTVSQLCCDCGIQSSMRMVSRYISSPWLWAPTRGTQLHYPLAPAHTLDTPGWTDVRTHLGTPAEFSCVLLPWQPPRPWSGPPSFAMTVCGLMINEKKMSTFAKAASDPSAASMAARRSLYRLKRCLRWSA